MIDHFIYEIKTLKLFAKNKKIVAYIYSLPLFTFKTKNKSIFFYDCTYLVIPFWGYSFHLESEIKILPS